MFDVAHGFAPRVLLNKLVELDGDICLYLTAPMVSMLAWKGEALVVLEGMQVAIMTREASNNMLLRVTSLSYDNSELVNRQVLGLGADGAALKVELAECMYLEFRLDQLTLAMTSLDKRLTGKGIG